MKIDNFDTFLKHLTFESDFDRYIVHIMKRAKDEDGKKYGVNETNRLLKTFYITSKEYLEKKIPVIKDLCESNCARAYILPQVRNNEDCLKMMLKMIVDNLSNPTIKPDHLIRTSYCGMHSSRAKKWIIDLDEENLNEYSRIRFLLEKMVAETGKSKDEIYDVPTVHGRHIITPPFNVLKALNENRWIFEGLKNEYGHDVEKSLVWLKKYADESILNKDGELRIKKLEHIYGPINEVTVGKMVLSAIEKKYENPLSDKVDYEYGLYHNETKTDITGVLHKDGMSLLYFNDCKED